MSAKKSNMLPDYILCQNTRPVIVITKLLLKNGKSCDWRGSSQRDYRDVTLQRFDCKCWLVPNSRIILHLILYFSFTKINTAKTVNNVCSNGKNWFKSEEKKIYIYIYIYYIIYIYIYIYYILYYIILYYIILYILYIYIYTQTDR